MEPASTTYSDLFFLGRSVIYTWGHSIHLVWERWCYGDGAVADVTEQYSGLFPHLAARASPGWFNYLKEQSSSKRANADWKHLFKDSCLPACFWVRSISLILRHNFVSGVYFTPKWRQHSWMVYVIIARKWPWQHCNHNCFFLVKGVTIATPRPGPSALHKATAASDRRAPKLAFPLGKSPLTSHSSSCTLYLIEIPKDFDVASHDAAEFSFEAPHRVESLITPSGGVAQPEFDAELVAMLAQTAVNIRLS